MIQIDVSAAALWVVGFVFSGLVGIVVYFIRGLIDRIAVAEEKATDAHQKVARFEEALEKFVEEVKGVRRDLRSIHTIDKQLAKLEVQLELLLRKDGYYTSGHGSGGDSSKR